MKFIDYVNLSPMEKLGYNLKKFFVNLPGNLKKIGLAIVNFFKRLGLGIGRGFAGFFSRFIKGDWATKLSYLIMGFSNMIRGQIVKGVLFLVAEVGFILFMIGFGADKIYKLGFFNNGTIGFKETEIRTNKYGISKTFLGDDSMVLLLYGVMTLVVIAVFIVCYVASTKSAYKAQQAQAAGEKLPTFKQEMKAFGDEKFHVTLLSFPCLTISIFTIMPLIFMILTAFTSYNHEHIGKLFGWQGFHTFGEVFSNIGAANMGETFVELTKWTLIWAVLATVVNYILGIVVALLINKKGIKLKSLWRTLFVVTVAVPQFVSLLLMSQMLDVNGGAINVLLTDVLHITNEYVNFLGNDNYWVARITVLVVNVWVGIPYTILITSGILMNIPADLYESATIDGAGPVRSFFSITLPYMLFVTTPYLITTFVGNINNFNVIYLLTTNQQNTNDLYNAGHTDLLVTWLFKLTTQSMDYNYASAIGILVFIVCATVSLLTFNLTKSAKNEEEFS